MTPAAGSVRVWEKMDATIDSDPRIAACHPHEAACLAVYLFILRRGRLDGHPGKVKPHSLEIHYLSRMTFLPADLLRDEVLVKLIKHGLIQIWRDEAEYVVQLRNVLQDAAGVSRPVSEVVTEAIADSDFVLAAGWEGYETKPQATGPRTSAQVRNDRWRKKQRQLAKVGKRAQQDAERLQTHLQTHLQTRTSTTSADDRLQTPSRDPLADGREIDRENRERDKIHTVPDFSGTMTGKNSEDNSSTEEPTGKPKSRIKAERIPERCWRCADYLRDMVLDRNPEADIGRRPWDGQRRPPNVHAKPPPDPLRKQGHRLKWADTIRLIVENDGRTYEALTEVIKWLWVGQPRSLGTGFIVESPDSLREKWGAIRMHMNGRAAQPPPTDPGGVDRAVAKLEEAMAKQAKAPDPDDDGGDS